MKQCNDSCCQCYQREANVHCPKYYNVETYVGKEEGVLGAIKIKFKSVPCDECFDMYKRRCRMRDTFYNKMKMFELLEEARINLEFIEKLKKIPDEYYNLSTAYTQLKRIHDVYAKYLGADIE